MGRHSTSRARTSRTPRRCGTRSHGPRATRSDSPHEPLGHPHPRHLPRDRIPAPDDESAEAASDVAAIAQSNAGDDDHALKKHWLAILVLFLIATAWGMTFTLIKSILTQIAPEPFIFWRFTIAGLALLIFARRIERDAIWPGMILGLLVFTGYWCQTRALLTISPSRSALLTGVYVVMVPFADRLLYHARIASVAWIGSMLAVIGTAMLIGGV